MDVTNLEARAFSLFCFLVLRTSKNKKSENALGSRLGRDIRQRFHLIERFDIMTVVQGDLHRLPLGTPCHFNLYLVNVKTTCSDLTACTGHTKSF